MNAQDRRILSRTLYGEARGEYASVGIAGLIAVGNVVLNRLHRGGWYGATVSEVCLKPKQFSCWNGADPNRPLLEKPDLEIEPLFPVIHKVIDQVFSENWPDLTQGSTHYHAVSCQPFWAKGVKGRVQLGNHLFYQLERS